MLSKKRKLNKKTGASYSCIVQNSKRNKNSKRKLTFNFKCSRNKVFVLFVRHCVSCANTALGKFVDNPKKSLIDKFSREPLCTNKGVVESFNYGFRFKTELISDINKKYNFKGIKLYSSVLPRSLETAKLFSAGYHYGKKSSVPKIIGDITRMNYIQEHSNKLENLLKEQCIKKGSQNITNKKKSDIHAKLLNKLIKSNTNIDCENILGLKNGIVGLVHNSNDYEYWKHNILPSLNPNILHIVVSHGGYISENVLRPLLDNSKINENLKNELKMKLGNWYSSHKILNLDSFLIEYNKIDWYTPRLKKVLNGFDKNFTDNNLDKNPIDLSVIINRGIHNYEGLTNCNYKWSEDIEKYYNN